MVIQEQDLGQGNVDWLKRGADLVAGLLDGTDPERWLRERGLTNLPIYHRLRAVATDSKGGPGSGNPGHAGRPGQVGGSAPSQGDTSGAGSDRRAYVQNEVERLYQAGKATDLLFEHGSPPGRWRSDRQAQHVEIVNDLMDRAKSVPADRQSLLMGG